MRRQDNGVRMRHRRAKCVKGLCARAEGLGEGKVGIVLELTCCEGEEGIEEEDEREERRHWGRARWRRREVESL